MAKKTVGQIIRESRESVGLSQREAAKKSGVTQAQWSRIEADKSSPTVDTLELIAIALGVNIKDLLPDD